MNFSKTHLLPLDSSRWESLGGTYGGSKAPELLRQLLDLLPNLSGSNAQATLKSLEAYDAIESQIIDDVFHQQTVWTGAIAVVPYLVEIAKHLPANRRCHLLYWCGVIHLEHFPGEDVSDLMEAYTAATDRAYQETIQFGETTCLEEESQFELMVALAGFEDELYIYYTLRGEDWIEFESACCSKPLEAVFIKRNSFHVFQPDTCQIDYDSDRIEGPSVIIEPTVEFPKLLADGLFCEYRTLHRVAIAGNHNAFLNWLRCASGMFCCPICQKTTRLPLG